MPHVSNDRDVTGGSGGGGDDLCSSDEIKVFKEEDGEDEKRSTCDRVNDDKCDLIDLSESDIKSENSHSYPTGKHGSRNDLSPVYGKTEHPTHATFNMGYLVSPYPYSNGPPPALPVSMASKMGLGGPTHAGAGLPFFCHNGEHLTQPPPAHMGIPPYQLDPKGTGLPRPPMYPFAGAQYPYPMLSPEMTQAAASWHAPYPISSTGTPPGFRGPYPSIPITSSALPSDFYRFPPTGILPSHASLGPHPHPALVTTGPKQELLHHSELNHRSQTLDHHKNSNDNGKDSCHATNNNQDKKKPHIKKPLNAFMLYMKEMRAKVVAECTLKESAAINQILGRRWHSLSREEQAKYYEKARQERQLHMELYPGWSARDNYGYGAKKKKRKKERVAIVDSAAGTANNVGAVAGGNSMKKCRARYGLDQQSQWCKPCRRKKRCIRYVENGGDSGNQSDDNAGSGTSTVDGKSAEDDDAESFQHSLSSPGALSVLSSLTSPSMILPSPNASLASPSVSLASPCMSMQSPLTPHGLDYDCPQANTSKSSIPPSCLPLLMHPLAGPIQPSKNPVGTNPHDINNPLSVNQLTGKCVKTNSSSSSSSSSSISSSGSSSNNSAATAASPAAATNKNSRPIIRVT